MYDVAAADQIAFASKGAAVRRVDSPGYMLMIGLALCDGDRHNTRTVAVTRDTDRPAPCYLICSVRNEDRNLPRHRNSTNTASTSQPAMAWHNCSYCLLFCNDSLLIDIKTVRGASPSSSRAPSVDTSYYDVELVTELHKRLLVVQAEREREEVNAQADAEGRRDEKQADVETNDKQADDEDRHDGSPHPSADHTPFFKESLARRWSWPSFMQSVS